MKQPKIILSTVFLVFTAFSAVFAQENYSTETEKYLYWQPEIKIQFSDYKEPSDTNCIKFNKRYGYKMAGVIDIRGFVDIPKRKGKIDKVYIVPVFCKNCSCIISEDSLELKVDQLCFDLAEIYARTARQYLLDTQKALNIDNPNTMFFTTIKNTCNKEMRTAFGQIFREILIDKKENAYQEWRKKIDKTLEETKEFATKPEECYRFILDKPIEKGYKQVKYIVGDMNRTEKSE
jgi:hypothetical protein